jgi:hypothetical protein
MEWPIILVLMFLVYFLPSIQAYSRNHNNSEAILCTNLLLGWTVIGWVIAFIWASTNNVRGR